VFALLVAHPWQKLIAVGLAVVFWLFVDARINGTTTRTIPLVTVGTQSVSGEKLERLAVVLPTDRVVGRRFFDGDRELDKVEVVVSGPRFRVDALKDDVLNLQVTKFLSLDWAARTNVELTADDIRRDRPLEQLRIELVPPRIRLEVERVEERPFTLTWNLVDVQEGPFADRLRRETCKFAPETAVVLGSANGIETLTNRGGKPFRAVLKGLPNDRQASASLELVGGAELGLRLAAVPVMRVDVLPQTQRFDLELPILVDDLSLPAEARGTYKPETRTKTVAIRAGGTLRDLLVQQTDDGEAGDGKKLADYAAQNLRLMVYVRPEASLGQEIEREARLLFVGKVYQSIDRTEFSLQDPVVIKLRRQ
jgi:hypothetical protein